MRKTVQQLFKLDDAAVEIYLDEMEHRERNLRGGNNVIQFSYYNEILPEEEIEKFRKDLNTINLELSYIDQSGTMQASIAESVTNFWVSLNVIDYVVSNVPWDIAVYFFYKAWQATKAKIFPRIHSDGNKTFDEPSTRITFEIKTDKFNRYTVAFIIHPDIDPDLVLKALKRIPKVISKINKECKKMEYLYPVRDDKYAINKKGNWKLIEVFPDVLMPKKK
jgi:hypothetical protein